MKLGLLFKEAPEPLTVFYCMNHEYVCSAKFFDPHELRKHMKEVHDYVYEYIYEESKYSPNGYFQKSWMKAEESQGLMQAPIEVPIRPLRRWFITDEEKTNMAKKNTCFCGKKFKWPRRKYCGDECANTWWFEKNSVWDGHKTHFLHKQKSKVVGGYRFYTCTKCTQQVKYPEIDHIIAIILGGHPWDYRNLQVLCEECHKIKTKSDVSILAWWKRQAKYDIGPIIPDPQLTLDDELNFNYVF